MLNERKILNKYYYNQQFKNFSFFTELNKNYFVIKFLIKKSNLVFS